MTKHFRIERDGLPNPLAPHRLNFFWPSSSSERVGHRNRPSDTVSRQKQLSDYKRISPDALCRRVAHSILSLCFDPIKQLLRTILVGLPMTVVIGCTPTISPRLEREAAIHTLQWLDESNGLIQKLEVDSRFQNILSRLDAALVGEALKEAKNNAVYDSLIRPPWRVFVVKDATFFGNFAKSNLNRSSYAPQGVSVSGVGEGSSSLDLQSQLSSHQVNSRMVIGPNAFSLGAGVIVISTSLLRETTCDAEIAAIIAHEMSHQILGHTRRALARQRGASEGSPGIEFDLQEELDADALSLRLLEVGRYDPRYALSSLLISERMSYRYNTDEKVKTAPDWWRLRSSAMYKALNECRFRPKIGTDISEHTRLVKLLRSR